MPKRPLRKLIVLLFSVLAAASAFAEPITFTGGPYLRLRHEYWNNIFDLKDTIKDTRNYYRIKISLWGKLDLAKDISFYGRLTNESKAYVQYYIYVPPNSDRLGDATYSINETVFDNLFVDLKNVLSSPVDLRLGRQDFLGTYGEGFLIMDGTPLDGSRTYYFNAGKATWHLNDSNTLDALYIQDTTQDKFLVINEIPNGQPLNYSDEIAYGLYHKDDAIENLHWENYYLWKWEERGGPGLSAKETKLSTVGSFAKYTRGLLTLRSQLAYQYGNYGSDQREGLGGYIFIDKTMGNTSWTPQLSAGYIYLSGDDPKTAKNEAWDPLFSRWPWISELYVLNLNSESGMGYWTNMQVWRAGVSANPVKKGKISLFYNLLYANQNVTGAMFGTGKTRGQLPQARIDYTFTKNISAYFLAEYFMPGDFYVSSTDPAIFTRAEVQFKY